MARMPEANKATLKRQLTAEVMGALIQRPDLRVVKVADGAPDNWSYLGESCRLARRCSISIMRLSISVPRWEPPMGRERPQYQERLETLSDGAARCAGGGGHRHGGAGSLADALPPSSGDS